LLLILILFYIVFYHESGNRKIISQNYSYPISKNLNNYTFNEYNVKKNSEYIRFKEMPIKYYIKIDTSSYKTKIPVDDEYEKEIVRRAIKIIENSTDKIIKFIEVKEPERADLLIYGLPPNPYSDDRLIMEGNAGPTEISEGIISKAEIILYASKLSFYQQNTDYFIRDGWIWKSTEYNAIDKIGWQVGDKCGYFPQTEIHEILHTFGFGHNFNNSYSVMAPILHPVQTCKNKEIDKEIISCLKYIYTGGKILGNCSSLNLYPWEEEKEPEDFRWDSLPVSYSLHNCSETQKWNLQKAEKIIEKYAEKNIYLYKENEPAQINFYCDLTFNDVLLNKETDFWDTTNYFPSAQPVYYYKNENIGEVRVYLFAQDRACGGIEVHELLHSIGLRSHYGPWMKQETEMCDLNTMLIDRKSINKLKEIYKSE